LSNKAHLSKYDFVIYLLISTVETVGYAAAIFYVFILSFNSYHSSKSLTEISLSKDILKFTLPPPLVCPKAYHDKSIRNVNM